MADGKNLVGVDIGSSAIKVCQLKESRKGLVLVKLGYEPLPPQTIVDGHIMNSSAVVEALGKVFRDANVKQRDVALGVSGQSVIIRKISVPLMTSAELEEQIQWEAEQHIPFDIKDVQIDYEVLRKRPEAGQMDLLLVAAKRDEINDYAELAREAKLKPLCVDIDAFCLQNIFEQTYGLSADTTVALLNIGASLTSLNIVSRGISAFTRDIANGGGSFTDEIQKQLSVSREQADAYKMGGTGTEPVPAQVQAVVAQVADGLAGEIQRSLDFFLATSGETEISRIYLAGGGASLPSLAAAIERRARVPVERFNPLSKVTTEGKDVDLDFATAHGEQIAVALGLALRKDREKRA
ncbi:MAG: type IV pilus assembly protein PilM [Polyangiales bacterium]